MFFLIIHTKQKKSY